MISQILVDNFGMTIGTCGCMPAVCVTDEFARLIASVFGFFASPILSSYLVEEMTLMKDESVIQSIADLQNESYSIYAPHELKDFDFG